VFKRSRRRQRAKSYFYGYSQSRHVHCPVGQIVNDTMESSTQGSQGLFAWRDAQEIFEQVKSVDDFAYPGTSSTGIRANRHVLSIRAKGEITYQISNGNLAGAAWVSVYVVKPRKSIPNSGIGNPAFVNSFDIINNNANSAYLPDYGDATGLAINAAGTGGVVNIMQNSTPQSKPTINQTNFAHTPFMVPNFTENFKVLKVHKMVIPAGGQSMIKVKTGWKFIPRQVYQKIGTGLGTSGADWSVYRPWFGREVFVRFHGQPVHDTTTESKVNYGSVGLDVVAIKKYWYSHSARPLPSYRMDANVGQPTDIVAQLPSGTTEPVGDTEPAP